MFQRLDWTRFAPILQPSQTSAVIEMLNVDIIIITIIDVNAKLAIQIVEGNVIQVSEK